MATAKKASAKTAAKKKPAQPSAEVVRLQAEVEHWKQVAREQAQAAGMGGRYLARLGLD